jgi:hypothetical protein
VPALGPGSYGSAPAQEEGCHHLALADGHGTWGGSY